jgi:hypothetical protein
MVRVSSELAEDAVSLAEFLVAELAYNIETAIDTAAFNDCGTSTYKGISGVRKMSSALAGYILATSGNDTWAEFTMADIDRPPPSGPVAMLV